MSAFRRLGQLKTQSISKGANWVSAHLVNKLVVQEAMDPVDAHVGEEQEGDHADDDPRPTWERKRDSPPCALPQQVVWHPLVD